MATPSISTLANTPHHQQALRPKTLIRIKFDPAQVRILGLGWVRAKATAAVVVLGACGTSPGTSSVQGNGNGGQAQVAFGGQTQVGTREIPNLGGQLATALTTTSTRAVGGTTFGAGGTAKGSAEAGGEGGHGGVTTQTWLSATGVPSGGASATGGTLAGGTSGKGTATAGTSVVGNPQRVLLSDEGNRCVTLMDLKSPNSAVWRRTLNDPTKHGDSMRDLQLVGNDRVAVSVAKGYVELDIKTGEVKKEVSVFDGVETLRRLPNGNTILGANANGGVTLQELDSRDAPIVAHKVTFTNYTQLRLMRRTPQGTFLIAVGSKLAEVNWDKQSLWEMAILGGDWVFQGLRLADNTIAVTSGYGAAIQVIDPATKKVLKTIGGKSQPDAATIVPNFYAGFQVLANGHFTVTNWEGHGGGNGSKGVQLLEYDEAGVLVWKWKQEPSLVSSLHQAIVLDGLDTTKLHDDVNGVLSPVTQ